VSGKISTPETPARHAGERLGKRPPERSPGRGTRPPLGWRQRVALAVAGTIAGLAIAEIGARALGYDFRPHMRNRVYFAEPDALLGWRNRPGVSGPYGGDEFLTWVTINADAQRGRAYPRERTPGTFRIAVLGDSQAWGDGVADDETFADLLDVAGGDRVEVLNFSAPGYGTDQELLALDDRAARWAPDVVVIATYIGNDLADNASPGTWQYPKPYFRSGARGELVLEGVPVAIPRATHLAVDAYRLAMRYSAFLNAIGEATANAPPPFLRVDELPAHTPIHRTIYGPRPTDADERTLDLTERLLTTAAEHARAIGARPVVLLVPDLWQVDVANRPDWRRELRAAGADWRRPQRRLTQALEGRGIEVIDALPALARASRHARVGDEHTYYRGWRHLTARGHRTLARLLAPRLGVATPRGEVAPAAAGRATPAGSGVDESEQHGGARQP